MVKLSGRLKSFRNGFLKGILLIFLALLGISIVQVVLIKYINPPFTIPMVWEWVLKHSAGRPFKSFSYEWRSLEDISPHLKRAVLAGEDQRFLSHNGFDFIELRRIFKEFVDRGRIRGGSTITMQAARSLYLIPCRSLFRKAIEAWYTIFMEIFWDKRRILEIYLNCVDWGSGIVGAEAAAQSYYGCTAQKLNGQQAAMMTAILPAPHRLSPLKPDESLIWRQQRILRDMKLMPQL
ncbi:MAG: monofunctional biosynthetic peptidoglycan transglycosylase [Desulfamplus sp.]|nr:monofunctional biosynthetic peptidoglycan transglycosylase [Desulfamplus sp.]